MPPTFTSPPNPARSFAASTFRFACIMLSRSVSVPAR